MAARRIALVTALVLVLGACGGDGSVLSVGTTAGPGGTEPTPTTPGGTTPVDGSLTPPAASTGVPETAEVLPPDPATVIETGRWGPVYDRRIVIRLADDAGAEAAGQAAAAVAGTVVAVIEDFSLAEIEIRDGGEAAIAAALDILEGRPEVAIAAASTVLEASWEVADRPCGPLDHLALQQGTRSDQYRLTGVEDAWRLVRASGVATTPPKIGIVDGFSLPVGYHGSWVSEVIDAAPGNPPGVLDAILGDGGATIAAVDVFGTSRTTSVTSSIAGVRQMVRGGAKVINLSLGHAGATSGQIALWRQFLRDLAVRHPDVVVVASANNQAADSATSIPGGLAEPNLITVGGLDHTGKRWEETWTDADGVTHTAGSNHMVTGGEVTLAVLADDVYTGFDSNGEPVSKDGTSFAAPQVTAAVAVLKALDPSLTAAEIKQILVDTAATEIADPAINERITQVDPSLGGRMLRVDNAVWSVLQRLGVEGTREELMGRATLEANARQVGDDPLSYRLTAAAPGGADGTAVSIVVNGPGALAPGGDTQTIIDGTVRWRWGFFTQGDSAQFTLTRTDTGACARLVITTGTGGEPSTTTTSTTPTPTSAPVDCDDCPAGLAGIECRLHCVEIGS
ncbi:MAG: S8/S53 family peptidase [Actinobacteria bacterium]|nr:S8/S53 family peptidase [Actinomycetota bacterium]